MSAALEFKSTDDGQGSVLAPPANKFVTFSAGNKGYGVDIMAVREIRSWSPTTELPDGSYSACGVLDIRGAVMEVHDLSAMLGGQRLHAEPGRVVLAASLGDTNVGILVDLVSDIILSKDEEFCAAPSIGGDDSNAKVSRLVRQEDRLIAILNLPALFPMVSMH
ncbi:MAG: chemotaxis protein CheW [Candidatus Devosia euplotis]|nr:chemotaxis protein CheW [Candidatus Devosia euplotis]